jgi:predicted dehydrogenase
MNRRKFMQSVAAAGSSLAGVGKLAQARGSKAASETVVVGVMGVNGRGASLARSFASLSGSAVAYICDVDERASGRVAAAVADATGTKPQTVGDFRKVLEDRSVDALVIAAPDHWHGPATIRACAAGKHVYVEKPACHNPREGELMVAAARKHERVVQVGMQRRSMPKIIEGVEKLRAGAIGRVLFARGWYNNSRATIGHGNTAEVPSWLDYDLWQGPAPEREFRDNVIHYNWHWFWHWGTGELGNNGIHALDVCRWGLNVEYPLRVTAGGGMYFYDDDQQTPDTHTVTYDFGDKGITWEGRNWHRRGFEDSMFGMEFYGDQGSMVMRGRGGYAIYDPRNKLVEEQSGSASDRPHIENFLECVRSSSRPHAEIEEGHKSTLLCHLGNIAYRTGRSVNLDPETHQVVGDAEQAQLWGREYRRGWEPVV